MIYAYIVVSNLIILPLFMRYLLSNVSFGSRGEHQERKGTHGGRLRPLLWAVHHKWATFHFKSPQISAIQSHLDQILLLTKPCGFILQKERCMYVWILCSKWTVVQMVLKVQWHIMTYLHHLCFWQWINL